MGLPPVRKRTDYSDIDKDDLVFALFYDRIAPTTAMSEQGEERKALDLLIPDSEIRATIGAITAEVDLSAWRRKAIKAIKGGKSAAVRFESEAIPADEQARIRAALEEATTPADVVKVFEVKATAADPIDALIDDELEQALVWAQKASEG